MASATVIGSGPNGLAAAITLARTGVETTVFERNQQIGGACSTAQVTLPGFRHDLGSSVYPMGAASPFFRSLPFSLPWIQPGACCAHPLDDGTAVMLERSVAATAAGLDAADRKAYLCAMRPLAEGFEALVDDLLMPVIHMPHHPLRLAAFGPQALLPASVLARVRFSGARARALFAGMSAHSVLPLSTAGSAAVGLVLMAAGHAVGWPIAGGGAQTITDSLADYLLSLGGSIETGHEVMQLSASDGQSHLTLADVTPPQLLHIAGDALPATFRRQLLNFKMGAGAFKVDYALSEPIPWKAKECARAATVHVGGTMEEIEASERGFNSDRPFVLVVQPSLFDPSRAPRGKHTAWAYCHVPNGSLADHLPSLEDQLNRFAPGFRDCILARKVWPPATLEKWNPNLVGGDVSAGKMNLKQLVFRPTPQLYKTPLRGLYLCGASTPPGGGVHGMPGYLAARMALRGLD
jgi:phytoene dehydrogenase-like protein